MSKQIISNIDSMIGYLKMVKKSCKEGTPQNTDALSILSLVSIELNGTYKDIKKHFNLKED